MPKKGSQSSNGEHLSAAERYEVLDRQGEGVLFVVYRVRERATMTTFALKALRHSYARHQQFCKAWQKVAHTAIHTQLPHIAEAYEMGIEEGTPYLVEEWLPGHTLEERLRRAPFGRIETASLARRMAIGLAGLHADGQIHGDFRPRQVMFNSSAELKITDAGWQYAVSSGGLSLVDVFPDSAYYLAPELWQGDPPSPASDIYALGVVLYRMLTGKLPFDGGSPVALAQQHQESFPVLPSQFNSGCSRQLQDIAMGMLHKDPARRGAPLEHLVHLSSAQAPQSSPQSTPPPTSSSVAQRETPSQKPKKILTRKELGKKELKGAVLAFFWALVAIALLVAIVLGAINFWMSGAPPEVRVPNYIGMNQTDAAAILQQQKLGMDVGREVFDPKRPSGTVLSGSPQPGAIVRAGRQILVTVSRGKEPIRMYDFRSLTLDQTKRIMRKHGLQLGQISDQYDDKIPKGYIIAQSPAPGQYFHRSDPISFVVSDGPSPESTQDDQSDQPDQSSTDNTFESNLPRDTSQDDSRLPSDDATQGLSSQDVKINIQMPPHSAPQLVTIIVNDATGEHTIYSEMKKSGDTINQTVHVAKTPSSQASVQVYAGGQLLREMQF